MSSPLSLSQSVTIGLCGRKQCGKSTLASVLVSKGYTAINFADPLKDCISTAFGVSLEDIETFKTDNVKMFTFTENSFDAISNMLSSVGITFELSLQSRRKLSSVKFTMRRILQIVGTDIMRAHDQDIFIKLVKQRTEGPGGKFVFGDIRFPNEKWYVEHVLGGVVFLILRPSYRRGPEPSNPESQIRLAESTAADTHISETLLCHTDFDIEKILINNTTYDSFKAAFAWIVDTPDALGVRRLAIAERNRLVESTTQRKMGIDRFCAKKLICTLRSQELIEKMLYNFNNHGEQYYEFVPNVVSVSIQRLLNEHELWFILFSLESTGRAVLQIRAEKSGVLSYTIQALGIPAPRDTEVPIQLYITNDNPFLIETVKRIAGAKLTYRCLK